MRIEAKQRTRVKYETGVKHEAKRIIEAKQADLHQYTLNNINNQDHIIASNYIGHSTVYLQTEKHEELFDYLHQLGYREMYITFEIYNENSLDDYPITNDVVLINSIRRFRELCAECEDILYFSPEIILASPETKQLYIRYHISIIERSEIESYSDVPMILRYSAYLASFDRLYGYIVKSGLNIKDKSDKYTYMMNRWYSDIVQVIAKHD